MAQATETVEEKTQESQNQQNQAGQQDSKKQVQTAEFSEAAETETTGHGTSIDILLDMSVPITVAIGKTEILIQRLLQLGPGSVLKLDKPIEAPADLYLRDTKFATGSIVVVDGKFAVKIKEILGAGAAVTSNKE
jgi:flagellar motor switch protein FliN/FliY